MEKKLAEVVNLQVANWSVLFIKLHNYHWFVTGTEFFTLHDKFEQLYNEAASHIDNLAERLLSIGGKPVGTMKEILEISTLEEASGNESAQEMVQSIARDFDSLTKQLKEGMEVAEQAGDETTGDMLLAIHASVEKHNWMLKAFLGK
ncbi:MULTISPECIES: Dps family protein [Bacillus]|uniref:Dps family protein n=1 Tax=Bacillus TaxID=1386 RepID=UPI000BB69F49|nr:MULTISPECIES: Dps family protein [Bacillus]